MKKTAAIILLVLFAGLGTMAWFMDHGLFKHPSDCELHFRHDPSELAYSEHAKCRMRCRNVSTTEVQETYEHGVLNCEKSGVRDGTYRYALEKQDHEGDIIRLVVAEENNHHKVITVIRLDKPDLCECD